MRFLPVTGAFLHFSLLKCSYLVSFRNTFHIREVFFYFIFFWPLWQFWQGFFPFKSIGRHTYAHPLRQAERKMSYLPKVEKRKANNFLSLICCCCCQVTSVVSNSVWPHRRQPTRLPSLGVSRQEHWSGLPFPSPMRESEKWKWSRSVMSDSSRPHGLQPTRLLRPWDFPGKSTGVGCHCLLR